jgi:Lrp/AsnC family transcriptional regulator for asnA, asnC and gidA
MGKLDETDMKILSFLYRDASVSIPKLSKELGLNLSVTYSRIKRLARRGIISQFTVSVDESKLGLPATAVVAINLDPKQREQAIDQISKLDGVREITEVTGRYDVFVALKGRSLEDLHRRVSESIGKVPGVNQSETFVEIADRRPAVLFKISP